MDLRKYTQEIFDIAKSQGVDIGVGRDMFVECLTRGIKAYEGAGEHDFAALSAEWNSLPLEEQGAAKTAWSEFTQANYKQLTAFRRENDREGFAAFVESAIAESEAVEKE